MVSHPGVGCGCGHPHILFTAIMARYHVDDIFTLAVETPVYFICNSCAGAGDFSCGINHSACEAWFVTW